MVVRNFCAKSRCSGFSDEISNDDKPKSSAGRPPAAANRGGAPGFATGAYATPPTRGAVTTGGAVPTAVEGIPGGGGATELGAVIDAA